MIRLDRTDRKLQAFLGGAAAATNPTVTVSFISIPNTTKEDNSKYRGSTQFTVLAGTAETDICDAPKVNGTVIEIDYINIYNTDSSSVDVTVCIDDNTTNRIQVKMTLATTESAVWTPESGWKVVT